MSKSLVMHLVVNITDYNVTAVNSSLLQCFHLISEQFKILQNQMKFKLCQLLTDILNICGEVSQIQFSTEILACNRILQKQIGYMILVLAIVISYRVN